MQNRRRFLSLLGAGAASAPLAAKAVADGALAKSIGMNAVNGLGSAGFGLPSGNGPAEISQGPYIPYEKRLIGAADHIKLFGLPKTVEFNLRDQAKYVSSLDPDIACKTTWSMSIKIMTQRQRNYDRSVERIKIAGWQERGRQTLTKLLGFEWPW